MISSDVITFLLPVLLFLIVISVYLCYVVPVMGAGFIVGNVAICAYLYWMWERMLEKNELYEERATEYESYLLEILNNIDKIVYRGQTKSEIDNFEGLSNHTVSKAYDFYSEVNIHGTVMNILVYLIIFAFVGYAIQLYFNKEIKGVMFITFITVIILYRDKMATVIQQIPDFVEFLGRSNSVMKYFVNMKSDRSGDYKEMVLPFDKIVFENVSFQYKTNKKQIFDKWNSTILLNKKIIGITGISGKGKSTFAKLLLKMYPYEGNIYIDGVNIKEIDADYVRKNIVYVNQNAKLFDKKIFENMMYGCTETEQCDANLKKILANYPKIAELYKNMDIYEKSAGSLGENLSGGQRQVTNIIGGLINPAKIVILDEPTNALDGELKKEVLRLIRDVSKEKKSILIITHDKDVTQLFDATIKI
jgi:ABC-type bacteriocin/lantibiotic exporter with double-glycine peptidase domain